MTALETKASIADNAANTTKTTTPNTACSRMMASAAGSKLISQACSSANEVTSASATANRIMTMTRRRVVGSQATVESVEIDSLIRIRRDEWPALLPVVT